MSSFVKFDVIRKVYKARNPSTEEKEAYKQNAELFWHHWEQHLAWIPGTNLMHVLCAHIPEYWDHPFGTGNLLDLSSSGLELSNKQLRYINI